MKNFKLLIFSHTLVCCAFLFSTSTYAQRIFELMQQEGINLKEVQDEADRHFKAVGTGKGTGYKLFKRWEYHAARHVKNNGTTYTSTERAEAIRSSTNLNRTAAETISMSNLSELGPLSVARGGSGHSPGIGRVTAIYVEPVNQQIIYAGSPGGGLWKSTNAGSSWTPLGDQFENMIVNAVECDPSNTNIVYVGTGLGDVKKSTDGGLTFTTLLDETGVTYSILINPTNSNDIFAALSSGLYHTTDGGSTWTEIITMGVEDIMYKPGSTSVIYACGRSFYRSTNGGNSFTQITGLFTANVRSKIAVSPANSEYVYLVQTTANTGQFGGLFRSIDGGSTFNFRSSTLTVGNIIGNQGSRDMAITVSNTDAEEVHVGGLDLYKSTDGGISFNQETSWIYTNPLPYVHGDTEVLLTIGENIYVGCDGGVFKSTDAGASFTDLSAGLGIQQFYRISNSATNKYVVSGGAQDNGSSVMSGPSHQWQNYFGGDGMDQAIDPTNENIIFGSWQNGHLVKTVNGGASMTNIVTPPENGNGSWVTPMALDPNNSNRIYAGYQDLYRHDNGAIPGTPWINLTSTISFNGSKLANIEPCPSNSNVIYISTLHYGELYKSTNINSASPTWTALTAPVSFGMNDIGVDPYDENRLAMATSQGGLYYSTDGWATWTDISGGLPAVAKLSVVFDRSPDQGIYVAIDGTVFYKSNSVPNWINFSNNLPNVNITELELYYDQSNPADSRIRVATYGRGLWESPLYDDRDSGGGSSGGITCNSTITSFPYNESFETGFGGWAQGAGDGFDWTRKTGATPSSGTGPSAADDGSYYVYTEVSSPNFPSKTAILTSPCFNLSSTTSPELTFRYHMLGNAVGTVTLEATTDDATWTSIWSKTGTQGSSWLSATVGLSQYTSTTVKFRFNVVSGTSYQGDICIDKIAVGDNATPPTVFVPDPNKKYYLDAQHHNLRIAATGASEDPYTTSTNTTGANVEWKFVDKGNGYWHIDRAAGGTKPRLRSDNSANADMQETVSTGTYTYYGFSEGDISGTYFLTLPNGPTNYKRLQVDNSGVIKMVDTSHAGTWESFKITEVPTTNTFPDPNKKYYLDVPHHNRRIAATGDSEDLYHTFSTITGPDVEWKFVDNGNGLWFIDRAAGGAKPRLRTDNTLLADMQENTSNGTWESFELTTGAIAGTHFITAPNGPTNFKRLQLNSDGLFKMVPTSHAGTWESILVSEVPSAAAAKLQGDGGILESERVLVFPNPALSKVHVQLNTEGGEVILSIVSLTGKVMSQNTFKTHKGLNLLKVETGGMPAGSYWVQIQKGKTKIIKRIILQE